MSTKLTVIVDNIPHGGMRSEWGLSILAEYKDKMIPIVAASSDNMMMQYFVAKSPILKATQTNS